MQQNTSPAKTRIKTDIIEKKFQENPCMDLSSGLIWNLNPELQADKIQLKQFFCQITKYSFEFLSFDNFFSPQFPSFAEETKETNFSVKSSWQVNWVIMFQKDAVWMIVELVVRYGSMNVSNSNKSTAVKGK